MMILIANGDADRVFSDRRNFANLLKIALHNSRIERLSLTLSPSDILLLPNKSALEVRELWLLMRTPSSSDFLADVLLRFRKVQVRKGPPVPHLPYAREH